jgi:hypothetical protein
MPKTVVVIFSKKLLTPDEQEEVRVALNTKFTNVKVSEDNYSYLFPIISWGYSKLPAAEKIHTTVYELQSPPEYLSKKSCSADARLTKLEGEIDEAIDTINYSLIPSQHGLSSEDSFFLVGIRVGKAGKLDEEGRVNYISRC